MATTVFPSVPVSAVLGLLATVLGGGLVTAAVVGLRLRARSAHEGGAGSEAELPRETWRMPPLALLDRPRWSRGRTASMWALRGYLFFAVALLLVKAVQLGIGGHH